MYFYSSAGFPAGLVSLYFRSSPQYNFGYCSSSQTNFPTDLPSETDKVWTISLKRTPVEIRVLVNCNNEEVLNVVLSETECSESDWNTYWSRDVEKIMFTSKYDTASDYYRPGKYLIFQLMLA